MPPFSALPSESGQHAADSHKAELADLALALAEAGVPPEIADSVVATHAVEREKLWAFMEARRSWDDSFGWVPNNAVPPPPFPRINVSEGLPIEFAEYFRGAMAWRAGDTNGARTAWAALLELPTAERRFKSTWAAYMLGRSWEDNRPGKAERYYQQVRRYVDEGLADNAGLAAASLGREALIHYREGDPGAAIALYLQQAAAGDPGALISLRFAAADALQKRHRSLKSLARDPVSRRIITAYLVSSVYPQPPVHLDGLTRETAINTLARIKYFRSSATGWHRYGDATLLWLDAVERADIEEAEEAELLALAAYQAGEFETATRWLKKAPENSLALWLRAKLLLREGEVDQAAICLTSIVDEMQETAGSAFNSPAATNRNELALEFWSTRYSKRNPQEEVLGELGALLLVQGSYTDALDALLRSGFWMDAAYVAERVLTVEELKSYVELNWAEPAAADEEDEAYRCRNGYWENTSDETQAVEIRYLLARRLARLERRSEARAFYPKSLRPQLDALDSALALGSNEAAPQADRAAALWSAAQMLRANGMELTGTELQPDWAVHGGQFEEGVSVSERTTSLALPPAPDELQRSARHTTSPERRFHYRYLAAELAWQAAGLMPNNTDETATVLCTAGCWLKDRDPKAADRFYKALVNRCRRTSLGRTADEKRWFPNPDGSPNLQRKEDDGSPWQDPCLSSGQ